MTLPGSKTITYSYDEVGRLIGLTAWDDQHSDFHYDKAGRHVGTQRPNGLLSDYAYNPAGHLRRVRHRAGSSLRGQFNYTVDGRGNRTRAFERLAQSTTVSATYNKSASQVTFTRGTWTDVGDFKQTAQFSGRMQIAYTGDEALLTIGTGPDHGMIDISINDNYWRRFNTYTAQPGERVLHIPAVPTPPGETSGKLSIKVRSDNHFRSTGHVFRFKQLQVIDATYNERTIDYTYDGLSRLQQANYNTGERVYNYAYDLAGNLTNMNGATRTYNAANQLTNDGTNVLTYDPNGNLTNDGTNTYTWDRANRMLTAPNNTSYIYDGLGNRVSQTVSNTVTNYLLDLQPGLTKVLAATTRANTERYIHAPRGIHSMENTSGDWTYAVQDGLGSVRSEIDSTLNVSSVQNYAPYGEPFGTVGNFNTPFAFTGEPRDANGLQYHRARYYSPSLAGWLSLDPFEGVISEPMSLNSYSYVHGNPANLSDSSGMSVYALLALLPSRLPKSVNALNSGFCNSSGSGSLGGILNPPISQPTPPPPSPATCTPKSINWICEGSGSQYSCSEWLDEAYNMLACHGSPKLSGAASLLEAVGTRGTFRVTFQFILPSNSGAITPTGFFIGLESRYLDSSITDRRVALLMHEVFHIPQGGARFTTRGEVEAYNFESQIMAEFGFNLEDWRTDLLKFGPPSNVSRDLCDMCKARDILMERFPGNIVYASEALMTIDWGLISTLVWPYWCDLSC